MRASRRLRSISLAVLVVGVLGVAAAPMPATHATDVLQPGDHVATADGGCTLNFVFDGPAGETYLGIAGHCVDVGDRVRSDPHGAFGTVVYDDDRGQDFALIEVDEDKVDRVSPEVRGHPGTPTGVATREATGEGDPVSFSGWGLGFSLSAMTRQERTGTLVWDTDRMVCVEGPVAFGDSGGPVLHGPTGEALGIVSRISPFECGGWIVGSTVEGAILQATLDGFPITLRTA